MSHRQTKALALAALVGWAGIGGAGSAHAQGTAQSSQPPGHMPTRQMPNSPYGTGWAKPGGTTGSYIYNDPRLIDPNSSDAARRARGCPAPLLYDPASGRCR